MTPSFANGSVVLPSDVFGLTGKREAVFIHDEPYYDWRPADPNPHLAFVGRYEARRTKAKAAIALRQRQGATYVADGRKAPA